MKYINLYILPYKVVRRMFFCVRRPLVRQILVDKCKHAPRLCLRNESALIIAPHPDDEVLGIGGVIALKRSVAADVNIVYLTNGESSHKGCCRISLDEVAAARRDQAVQTAGILGVPKDHMHWIGLPSGRIPSRGEKGIDEAVEKVSTIIKAARPAEVYYPYQRDCWRDHEAAADIAEVAMSQSGVVCRPWCYFVWAWYKLSLIRAWKLAREDEAQVVDISDVLPKKLDAIETYLSTHPPACNQPYIGRLPRKFMEPFKLPYELILDARGRIGLEHLAVTDAISRDLRDETKK